MFYCTMSNVLNHIIKGILFPVELVLQLIFDTLRMILTIYTMVCIFCVILFSLHQECLIFDEKRLKRFQSTNFVYKFTLFFAKLKILRLSSS